jgi:3,4-dihydroxy 2-butanone 4-phosphate synthase/GTP cyclohydrolase II
MQRRGIGILIYLRQEGRGIGLMNKIRAYSLQEKGYDTVEANQKLGFDDDLRDYDLAVRILKRLKVKSVALITNNPGKIEGLERGGIRIAKRIPLVVSPNRFNQRYLRTKIVKLGHLAGHRRRRGRLRSAGIGGRT